MCASKFLQWQRESLFYLQESLCRREEVLSAPRISLFWKRSFFHLVYWMSSLYLGGVVFVCFGVCFCFVSENIRLFAFHLFSYNMRIVERPQGVLMTVRASSAHGKGEKRRHLNWQLGCHELWRSYGNKTSTWLRGNHLPGTVACMITSMPYRTNWEVSCKLKRWNVDRRGQRAILHAEQTLIRWPDLGCFLCYTTPASTGCS